MNDVIRRFNEIRGNDFTDKLIEYDKQARAEERAKTIDECISLIKTGQTLTEIEKAMNPKHLKKEASR